MRDDFIKGFILLSAPIHLVYEVGNSIWKNPQLSNIDAENDISSLMDLELGAYTSLQELSQTGYENSKEF